jgi:hypothetical protein
VNIRRSRAARAGPQNHGRWPIAFASSPHEAVPLCGRFEVRFPDGRPSRYFYWDAIAGRRLRPDLVGSVAAKRQGPIVGAQRTGRVGFRLIHREQQDVYCANRQDQRSGKGQCMRPIDPGHQTSVGLIPTVELT